MGGVMVKSSPPPPFLINILALFAEPAKWLSFTRV
jgi:hypothetical protein